MQEKKMQSVVAWVLCKVHVLCMQCVSPGDVGTQFYIHFEKPDFKSVFRACHVKVWLSETVSTKKLVASILGIKFSSKLE